MTRDPGRPPDHPLVELAHDLWGGLGHALADLAEPNAVASGRYEQMRIALRSARRIVDGLDLLVDELEAEARARGVTPSNEDGPRDDDFHIITIGGL